MGGIDEDPCHCLIEKKNLNDFLKINFKKEGYSAYASSQYMFLGWMVGWMEG